MSTRAIREALDLVQCTCVDHTCAGCRAQLAVESIERAAKWMVSGDQDAAKAVEYMTIMETIAKEAP